MTLLFYTVRGLEEALAAELRAKGYHVSWVRPSRVAAEGRGEWPRTASRAARLLGLGRAGASTRSLRLALRGLLVRGVPCRVRGYVHGRCYSARMLELVAAREASRRGCGPGVLLVDYYCGEGLLLAAVEEAVLWRGRRSYYVGGHPATLNPLIAAAIPFLAGVTSGVLLDPLCGSGTIPVEAALGAGLLGLCSDVERGYARIALEAAARAGAWVEVFVADVERHPVGKVDLVATDPPRGDKSVHVRLARAAVRLGRLAALVTPFREAASLVRGRVYATFQGGEKVYVAVGEPVE